MNLNGRFSTIAETEKSIVVGLIENITMENIEYSDILKIAGFYGISTAPDLFGFHFITPDGAKNGVVNCQLQIIRVFWNYLNNRRRECQLDQYRRRFLYPGPHGDRGESTK